VLAQTSLAVGREAPPRDEGFDLGFEALFRAEYSRLVSVAQRVVGDRCEAEDVAQEAFFLFYQRRKLDPTLASRWLYRTAWTLALTRLRSSRRRVLREQRHHEGSEPADPGVILEADERRQLVRAALRRIDRGKAQILVLRYSGLSYREVGEVLGIRIDQVGTRLRRAEAALERELDRAALA